MATDTTLVWSNVVAALGSAIVSTLLTAWYFQGFVTGKADVSAAKGAFAGVGVFAVETITYIPHILLLFGVLADMFTLEGVYSIPSLVGLFSIPLNFVMKYFWSGVIGILASIKQLYNIKAETPFTATSSTPEGEKVTMTENPMRAPIPKEGREVRASPAGIQRAVNIGTRGGAIEKYDGCDVQGFSKLSSEYAPQTLVVTATVFVYYILDLIVNRGWASATASIIMFAVLYIAETVVIGDCGYQFSKWFRSLLAFLEGVLFGGSAYAVVQTYYPNKLPSKVLPDLNIEDTSSPANVPSNAEVSAMMDTLYPSSAETAPTPAPVEATPVPGEPQPVVAST